MCVQVISLILSIKSLLRNRTPSSLLSALHLFSFAFTLARKTGITRAQLDPPRNAYHLQSNEEKDEWEQATEEPERWWKYTRLPATLGALSIIKSDSTASALWIFDRGQRCNMHTLTGTHTHWQAYELIQVCKTHEGAHVQTHSLYAIHFKKCWFAINSISDALYLQHHPPLNKKKEREEKKKTPGTFWNILIYIFT